ncbi:MAG: hypothetical protein ABJA78_01335 [Ferruginibacter sp.]
MNSILFADDIPANNDPEPSGLPGNAFRSTSTVTTLYDTSKIKITTVSSNNFVDSTVTVSVNLKDTTGLEYIKIYFQDNDSATLNRASSLQFNFKINAVYSGMQPINVAAVYGLPDGSTEYHVDTASVNVVNLAPLQGFRIDQDSADLITGVPYYPDYMVKYNGQWIPLPNNAPGIAVVIQNPAVVILDTQSAFVGQQVNTTAAYLTYFGFKDTILFKSYLPINSNCINKTIASGSVKNPAIWSKLSVPDVCDSVVIESGHTVILDTSVSIRTLRINSGASLTIQDSAVRLNISDPDNTQQFLDNYGTLNISNGTISINGQIKLYASSGFNMSGGNLLINGNNGNVGSSVANGSHLFNADISMQNFSFTGGTLQFINPPLGALSQAINCPFNFGDSSVLKFGNGISIVASNNSNGFGGNLLPAQVGKLIFDPATSMNNRIFINVNPLNVRTSVNVRSGNFKQQALLKVGH